MSKSIDRSSSNDKTNSKLCDQSDNSVLGLSDGAYSETRESTASLTVRRGSRGSTVYTEEESLSTREEESSEDELPISSVEDLLATLTLLFGESTPEELSTEEDEMSAIPPIYSGYTTNKSIVAFLEEFELFAATKDLNAARQRTVLEATLRGPAKTLFQQKIADGTIAAGTDATTHLVNCKNWLRT